VLILGVTPELRDGVAEAGGQAVLLDFSGAMHTAATSMLRRADAADETWIQDDWCGAALREGEFDLVVGDVSWWLLTARKQHELRDAIHAALKTDGLFVNRFYVCDPTRVDQSPSAVLARFLGAIDREPDDEQALRGTMYSWLYDHTSDRAHQRLDRERAYALVLDLASLPEFSRHEEYLHAFAARLRGPDFTSQSREELVDVVGARFKVMGEGHAEDYDSSSFPIIALEPS
jgi:hypothetical protein